MTTLARVFEHNSGTQVRAAVVDGEPWFVARDVAEILRYSNPPKAIRDHVPAAHRRVNGSFTPPYQGVDPQTVMISEAGLYRLIMRSRTPTAEAFQEWVTAEVLPAIRKTGRYETAPAIPQTYAEALQLAADQARQIEAQAAQLAVAAPKAESWDTLAAADGDWSVRDAAKVLSRDPLIALGERRLFTVLGEQQWTYRQRSDNRWRAYQRAVDSGWLSELPASHYHPRTGELQLDAPQVRVTTKGLHELHRRLGGLQPLRIGQQMELITTGPVRRP